MKGRYRDGYGGSDRERRGDGDGGGGLEEVFSGRGAGFESPWINTAVPHSAKKRLMQRVEAKNRR